MSHLQNKWKHWQTDVCDYQRKINPLIGSAGVAAVPMAARISQVEGRKANPSNFC